MIDRLQSLHQRREIAEAGGSGPQSGMAANFPKNPPPTGMAYSKNFVRAHTSGRFAFQGR